MLVSRRHNPVEQIIYVDWECHAIRKVCLPDGIWDTLRKVDSTQQFGRFGA
jgi:hypothetical protein